MPIEKVKGIETEWGIGIKDKNGFKPAETEDFRKMIDITREYLELPPDSQAGFVRGIENISRIRISESDRSNLSWAGSWHLHNNLLPNGGRLYIDGPHLEYSTPECISAKTLVAADRAGEALVGLARLFLNKELAEEGAELVVYKDNTDRRGNSYGCHENYLVSREAFNRIVNPGLLDVGYLASFFICRLIFTGSGKMGIESEEGRLQDAVYQISQRADFIQKLLGGSTTSERTLVNTRNEPLADESKFGRLHVITGDANLAEVANYMKAGITSIVLKMSEDDFLQGDIIVADPIRGIKLASLDLTCKKPVLETLAGRKLSSLDLSEEFFQRAKEYFSKVCQPSPEELDLMRLWEETNSDFRTDNKDRLRRRFDWQIKLCIFEDFLEEHGFSWADVGRAAFKNNGHTVKVSAYLDLKDVLYHHMDKEQGLYWAWKEAGGVEEVVTREEIVHLLKNPPPECRSYLRGRCVAKFFNDIDMLDWDKIVFKDERQARNKNFFISQARPVINLINPIWGGKADTEKIIDKAATFRDLISELKKVEE